MESHKDSSEKASKNTRLLLKTLADFDTDDTVGNIWRTFKSYMFAQGANLLSYHHFTPHDAPEKRNDNTLIYGFPDEWVDIYLRKNWVEIDPIILSSNFRVRPIRWLDIGDHVPLTDQQEEFMVELKRWMKGNGLGVPAFGPSSRTGYFGVGSTISIDHWSRMDINQIQWVCEAFHLRFCELKLSSPEKSFRLTEREIFILENMAMGRSDAMICGLIGAQLDSVKSSILRLQKKMGVSDRPSAILRATGCGLISPNIVSPKKL